MLFMLNDNLEEKINFLFKMISSNGEYISNVDLKKFYLMVNHDPNSSQLNKKQQSLEA